MAAADIASGAQKLVPPARERYRSSAVDEPGPPSGQATEVPSRTLAIKAEQHLSTGGAGSRSPCHRDIRRGLTKRCAACEKERHPARSIYRVAGQVAELSDALDLESRRD